MDSDLDQLATPFTNSESLSTDHNTHFVVELPSSSPPSNSNFLTWWRREYLKYKKHATPVEGVEGCTLRIQTSYELCPFSELNNTYTPHPVFRHAVTPDSLYTPRIAGIYPGYSLNRYQSVRFFPRSLSPYMQKVLDESLESTWMDYAYSEPQHLEDILQDVPEGGFSPLEDWARALKSQFIIHSSFALESACREVATSHGNGPDTEAVMVDTAVALGERFSRESDRSGGYRPLLFHSRKYIDLDNGLMVCDPGFDECCLLLGMTSPQISRPIHLLATLPDPDESASGGFAPTIEEKYLKIRMKFAPRPGSGERAVVRDYLFRIAEILAHVPSGRRWLQLVHVQDLPFGVDFSTFSLSFEDDIPIVLQRPVGHGYPGDGTPSVGMVALSLTNLFSGWYHCNRRRTQPPGE